MTNPPSGQSNPYKLTEVESDLPKPVTESRPWPLMAFASGCAIVNGAVGFGMIDTAVSVGATVVGSLLLLPTLSLAASVVLFAARQNLKGDRFFSYGLIALCIVWGVSFLAVLLG